VVKADMVMARGNEAIQPAGKPSIAKL